MQTTSCYHYYNKIGVIQEILNSLNSNTKLNYAYTAYLFNSGLIPATEQSKNIKLNRVSEKFDMMR